MPSPTAFKSGFEVDVGQRIDGYVIETIHIGHDAKVPREKYEFPMTIVITPADKTGSKEVDCEHVLQLLKDNVKVRKMCSGNIMIQCKRVA